MTSKNQNQKAAADTADKNVRAPIGEPWRWDKTAKQSQRRRVYKLVRAKRAAAGPLEVGEAWVEKQIGSKGWNTRGYLPHFDKPGALQMVTFRQGDAMPANRRHEWELLLGIKNERERRVGLEAYLDQGHGECHLQDPRCAAAVEDVLLKFDGKQYRLVGWVVMPNHVHVLVEVWTVTLDGLLKAWKGVSANALNRILGRKGRFWQEDYWDRLIRDEAHFRKALHYIESNPIKARLATAAAEWLHSSANPRRTWAGGDRYTSGRLAGSNWVRNEDSPPDWVALPTREQ